MERVMIFIDGNNFYHATKNYLNQSPKYKLEELCQNVTNKKPNRYLLRSYFYTVNEPHQQAIINALKKIPRISVNAEGYLKKNRIPGITFDPNDPSTYISEEKRTDINLTTDLLVGAYMNSYDTAIIFSADNDYLTPIKEIQKIGKIVELVITEGQPISENLRNTVDEVFELNEDDFKNCWNGTYISNRRQAQTTP